MSSINTQNAEADAHIDYQLLVTPATKQEVEAYRKRIEYRTWSRKRLVYISFMIGSVVTVVQFLLFTIDPNTYGAGTDNDSDRKLLSALGFGVAIVAFLNAAGFAIEFDMLRRHRTLARMHRFAKDNHIELIDGDIGTLEGSLMSGAGHSEAIDMGYRFPTGIEIGNYEYSVGQGKYETKFKWGFVKIPLSRRLPHLLLDSRHNNLTKNMTNLPARYRLSQQFELEGDFHKYFNVYVPGDYQTDALYVLTPDVMAALIDYAKRFDVEIVGDCVYLYANHWFKLDDSNKLQDLVNAADRIASQLVKQSKNYADSRVEGARVKNVVARPGKRLRKRHRVPVLLMVMLGLVASFVLFVLFYESEMFVFAFFTIAFLAVVIGVVFGILKLVRLYKMSQGDDL